jgi:thioredoxin 1
MVHTNDIKDVTDATFKEETADGTTIVDFWAPWCMPCKFQAPILEELAREMNGRVKIRKLNVDENEESALAFGITGIPTLVLFKDGEAVKTLVGMQSKNTLKQAIEKLS